MTSTRCGGGPPNVACHETITGTVDTLVLAIESDHQRQRSRGVALEDAGPDQQDRYLTPAKDLPCDAAEHRRTDRPPRRGRHHQQRCRAAGGVLDDPGGGVDVVDDRPGIAVPAVPQGPSFELVGVEALGMPGAETVTRSTRSAARGGERLHHREGPVAVASRSSATTSVLNIAPPIQVLVSRASADPGPGRAKRPDSSAGGSGDPVGTLVPVAAAPGGAP